MEGDHLRQVQPGRGGSVGRHSHCATQERCPAGQSQEEEGADERDRERHQHLRLRGRRPGHDVRIAAAGGEEASGDPQPPLHPRALLLGLDLGPNLAVTGSLSALLWLQAARSVGADASTATYSKLGLTLVPLTVTGALAALRL